MRLPYTIMHGGERVDLLAPIMSPIKMRSIANHLDLINRFNGGTVLPISVLQHSLHVAHLMGARCGLAGARLGLMHDAHEAYTGDMPTPIKRCMGPAWEAFELPWQERVLTYFGIEVTAELLAQLKHCDAIALATEWAQLMPAHQAFTDTLPDPDTSWLCVAGSGGVHTFLARAFEFGIIGSDCEPCRMGDGA